MNKILKFGLCLTVWIFSRDNAEAATFVIDDFRTPSFTTSPEGIVSDTVSGPGILGGERVIELTRISGFTNSAALTTNCNLITPIIQCMSFNSGVGSLGSLSLTYGSNMLPGIDVTNAGFNDGFVLLVQFADFPTNFTITAKDNSGNTSSFTQQTPGLVFLNPNTIRADFARFTGGLVDFADLDEVTFSFDATFPATDFQFNVVATENFDSTNDPNLNATTVHEPTPIRSLMGLLTLSMIFFGVKNRKVKF